MSQFGLSYRTLKSPAARGSLVMSSDSFILKMALSSYMAHTSVTQALTSHRLMVSSAPEYPITLRRVILWVLETSLSHNYLRPRTTLNPPTPHSPLRSCFPILSLENLLSNTSTNRPDHPAVNCWWMSSIEFLKTIQTPPTDQLSCSLERTSLTNSTEEESATT